MEQISFRDFELDSEDVGYIQGGGSATEIIHERFSIHLQSGLLDILEHACLSGYPDEDSISVSFDKKEVRAESRISVYLSIFFTEKTATSCDDFFLVEHHYVKVEVSVDLTSGETETLAEYPDCIDLN